MLSNWSKMKPEQFAKVYRKHHLVPEWSPRSFPKLVANNFIKCQHSWSKQQEQHMNFQDMTILYNFPTLLQVDIFGISPRPWISLNSVMCKKCRSEENTFFEKYYACLGRQGIQCGGLADVTDRCADCSFLFLQLVLLILNKYNNCNINTPIIGFCKI